MPKARVTLSRIYDEVNAAMWALLISAVCVFVLWSVPRVIEAAARMQAERVVRIEQEIAFYCRRWKFVPRTPEYARCTTDLRQYRESVERDAAEAEDDL